MLIWSYLFIPLVQISTYSSCSFLWFKLLMLLATFCVKSVSLTNSTFITPSVLSKANEKESLVWPVPNDLFQTAMVTVISLPPPEGLPGLWWCSTKFSVPVSMSFNKRTSMRELLWAKFHKRNSTSFSEMQGLHCKPINVMTTWTWCLHHLPADASTIIRY